jgi:hypothetical protein
LGSVNDYFKPITSIMKRVSTLSLAFVLAAGVCSAASSVSLPVSDVAAKAVPKGIVAAAKGTTAAPGEIVAAAPSAAAAMTIAPATAAALTIAPAAAAAPVMAVDLRIPLGTAGVSVNLQELSTMKTADLEKIAGRKMGWLTRLEFKLAQKKLRRSINADGTINNKRLAMLASKDMDGTEGFHLGGFALGLFLGLIGVLIAYLINDEKHDNRVKWSWIGLAVIVGIILLSIIL